MSTESTEQRVAIVTGASRGIGAAIGIALAQQGRHVVLSARSESTLASVQQQIIDQGGSASIHPCDMSNADAVVDLVESTAKTHGRLDILVNNAGITRDGLAMRIKDEQFDEVINVNLRSVFIACRTAIRPMMRQKWGRMINISSVSALVGNAGQANYAAAKAGVIGMTKTLAKELATKQITANVIAPGFVETDMTDVLSDQVKEHAKTVTPIGRFGRPEEIGAAVAYLASDLASFTTGQVLAVDGGMTMC